MTCWYPVFKTQMSFIISLTLSGCMYSDSIAPRLATILPSLDLHQTSQFYSSEFDIFLDMS